jgi:hypothetical protein
MSSQNGDTHKLDVALSIWIEDFLVGMFNNTQTPQREWVVVILIFVNLDGLVKINRLGELNCERDLGYAWYSCCVDSCNHL